MKYPIQPPEKIPLLLRPLVRLSERIAGVTLLPSRLLAWKPGLAFAVGLFEMSVEGAAKHLGTRTARVVRMRTSFAVACPFCIDLNGYRRERDRIGEAEMAVLRGDSDPESSGLFSERESVAILYAAALSQSPLMVDPELISRVQSLFGSRDAVILAALIAKVNFFARFCQGLGVTAPGLWFDDTQASRTKTE